MVPSLFLPLENFPVCFAALMHNKAFHLTLENKPEMLMPQECAYIYFSISGSERM